MPLSIRGAIARAAGLLDALDISITLRWFVQ